MVWPCTLQADVGLVSIYSFMAMLFERSDVQFVKSEFVPHFICLHIHIYEEECDIYTFAQAETQMRQRQSNQWAPAVKFGANAIRMQVVVNPYSTSTVSLTLEGWEPLSSLTWMKHGHRVNTSTSSPWFPQPAGEVNACTWTHMYTCTHAVKEQPGMHKPPASIFYYYNTVGWRQGWAVLHCSCTQAECARWAVTDTQPQTWVVTKKYRKDPAGSRKRANVV